MSTKFKDYFSDGSEAYSASRLRYPKELFSYLSSLTQSQERAWDCATESDQSALALSEYFSEVIATDASENQIENAIKKDGVTYHVEKAEKTLIENNFVNLVTVAQALHRFNIKGFSNEVIRVLMTKSVLAVWSYGLLEIDPRINKEINNLYSSTLGTYWPPERTF